MVCRCTHIDHTLGGCVWVDVCECESVKVVGIVNGQLPSKCTSIWYRGKNNPGKELVVC